MHSATIISKNIEDDLLCTGENLILTCRDQSTSTQRWFVQKDGAELALITFTTSSQLGTQPPKNFHYNFTLLSTLYNCFKSRLSLNVQNSMDNAVVECAGSLSRDRKTIRIAGL